MTKPLETLKTAWEKTHYLADNTDIIENILEYSDASDADDLIDYIQESYVHSVEVIYYHNAMEFLKEEDPSLHESLQIAAEFDYTTDKLNSELLATLLLKQKCSEELHGLRDDFEAFFEELEEEE